MQNTVKYLTSLRNRVFKLLPMKEAYDLGEDNHVYEYLHNLYYNYVGAAICHERLFSTAELMEVQNNIAFLVNRGNELEFSKWRSMVLRSTRLIGSVIDKYNEEA